MGLRDWRASAGLTQGELARKARVSRASVSHIELERYAPTAGFAGKVCRALSEALGFPVRTWDVFPAVFTPLRELKEHRDAA
jgi:DNA-binding XRE family transcriptional regulator